MKSSDNKELRDKLVGLGKNSMRKNYYSDLLKEKQLLEERIKERTLELEVANKELEGSYSELKKTQDYLLQSEKLAALGALVAGISHEVNTPLGICMTSATFLIDQLEKLRHLAKEGRLSIKQLDDLTENAIEAAMITVSNMEKSVALLSNFKLIAFDQSHYDYRKFNLHDYISKILINLHPEIKNKNVLITVDCDENLEIFGYPGVMNQIITHLVMNSLKHGTVQSHPMHILIHCSIDYQENCQKDDSKTIRMIYQDDGKGMSEDVAQKAFNPFFTTTLGSGGNGLGLFIIYNLIAVRLKGYIQLETTPNHGVKFTITFEEKQTIENTENI